MDKIEFERKLSGIMKLLLMALFVPIIFSLLYFISEVDWQWENENNTEEYNRSGELNTESSLIKDTGFEIVLTNCTSCHSDKLITQNRATRAGWQNMIRWMQRTQNLWDLGTNEQVILDYLAKNYAPEKIGRRKPLDDIEWYELK